MKIITYKAIKRSIAIIIALPFVLFACYWGMETCNDIQLWNRTRESKTLGLTPDQVISLIGQPEYRDRQSWEPVGTEIMVYTNHGSRICRINFEHGTAKNIERLSDH